MAKADVLVDVSILSNGLADTVSSNDFYDEVVRELGRAPWLTNFQILPAVDYSNTVSLPNNAVALHGVIYDNRWLHESMLRDLEPYRRDWRQIASSSGPITYVLEELTHLDIDLFPAPLMTGSPVVQFYDKCFPANNVTVIYTEYRSTIPAWLEWSVALGTLAREFTRNSDHADPDATVVAKQLSDVMLMMVS